MKIEVEITGNALRELERIGIGKEMLMRQSIRKLLLRALRVSYHNIKRKLKDRPNKDEITVTTIESEEPTNEI